MQFPSSHSIRKSPKSDLVNVWVLFRLQLILLHHSKDNVVMFWECAITVFIWIYTAARVYLEDMPWGGFRFAQHEQICSSMSVCEKKEETWKVSIIKHSHVPPILPVLLYEMRFVIMNSKRVQCVTGGIARL